MTTDKKIWLEGQAYWVSEELFRKLHQAATLEELQKCQQGKVKVIREAEALAMVHEEQAAAAKAQKGGSK